MAPRRAAAKEPTRRSKQTHALAKKGGQQLEQIPRFPKFNHFPAEIQWKIFREVMNGDPHFHVLRVGRVDNAGTGKWTLSFSPFDRNKDASGYRMYDLLSSVNPAAAAAVAHEMALRRTDEFQRLPFRMLKARIDGAKDLIVFDFARSTIPEMGYFHDDHQILNWQDRIFDSDSVAEKFQNTEKLAIKSSDKHYSCHDIGGNFHCVDVEDEEHASHASRNDAWRMCPKELAGLLNSFPKLREFHVIVEPYFGNKKHEHMDIYLKNYFACKYPPFPCPLSHDLPLRAKHTQQAHPISNNPLANPRTVLTTKPTASNRSPNSIFHGTTTIYIPFLDTTTISTTTTTTPNNATSTSTATTALSTPHHEPLPQPNRFPTLQDLHDLRAMLASLHAYLCLDLRASPSLSPPSQAGAGAGVGLGVYLEPGEGPYRMGPVERAQLVFGVLVAVPREKVRELGGGEVVGG